MLRGRCTHLSPENFSVSMTFPSSLTSNLSHICPRTPPATSLTSEACQPNLKPDSLAIHIPKQVQPRTIVDVGLRANHHQKTKKWTNNTYSSPSPPGFGNKYRSPLVEDSSTLVWCPLPPEWEPAQTRLLHPILQATLASKPCTEIQLSSFACLLFLPLAASINHELQLRPLDCCRNNKVSQQTCVARHSFRNLPESDPLDSSRSSSVSVENAVPIIVGVGLALFLLLCGTKLVPLWNPCVPKTLPSDTLPPSR